MSLKKLKFVFGRAENMGKGENAGYQHFLLFPLCFKKSLPSGLLNFWIVWLRINHGPLAKEKCMFVRDALVISTVSSQMTLGHT